MESLQQNTRIAPSGYREMEKGHIIQTSSELIERVRQRERKRIGGREKKIKRERKTTKGWLSGEKLLGGMGLTPEPIVCSLCFAAYRYHVAVQVQSRVRNHTVI